MGAKFIRAYQWDGLRRIERVGRVVTIESARTRWV